jgi:hypothetical protein
MKLNPNCKEVHKLASEQLDRELSLTENTGMRVHLLFCRACSNFNRQMKFIRQAMHKFPIE